MCLAEGMNQKSSEDLVAEALSAEQETENPRKTTEEAMREGFGIIDGGATRTFRSVEAIKSIAAMNQQRHQDDRILGVDPNDRPVFGFGNSSKDQCVSNLQVKITAGQKEGALKIHALDKGNGPVLLSVATLRSLKAVRARSRRLPRPRPTSCRATGALPGRPSAPGLDVRLLQEGLHK